MIVVLSGGTGTPKLLAGMKDVYQEFSVVVNTAEDLWISGNKICPDIDSVIYALAGVIDEKKWWGIKDDTFITHLELKKLGFDEFMMIGDRDRATHIMRSELLRRGFTLKQATDKLRESFGVKQEIFPMSEEEVSTYILTDKGWMHFQFFWVKEKGEPEVYDIKIRGIEKAKPSMGLIETIKRSKAVIIGPSNPVTSINPILMVYGIKEAVRKKKTVIVSPIVGKKPLSGPAGKFLKALGYEVSPKGVLEFYGDLADLFVVHIGDKFRSETCEVVEENIVMKKREDAIRLSRAILELL